LSYYRTIMSKPVILLTGYRGLAETFLETFLAADFRVSVLIRQREAVGPLLHRFPGIAYEVGDVTDAAVQAKWFHNTEQRFGRIDHLVNNAALPGPAGKLHEIAWEEYGKTLDVNLRAPIQLIQLWLLHHLAKKTSGTVINLSGGGATQARPGFSAYGLTKTALVRLTETLALEYPEQTFYAMSPGGLMTPMIETILKMDPKKVPPSELAEAKRREREGGEDPRKAAELALWLIKEKPASLNGKLIHAVWDDYKNQKGAAPEVGWWTLRRIDEPCRKQLSELA